jgi:asparagine synthetase B (glutamine-hydrolysing)
MCDISGLVNCGDRETLLRMTNVQTHRSPDDSGLWERREGPLLSFAHGHGSHRSSRRRTWCRLPEPFEWHVCRRDLRLARRFAEAVSGARSFRNQATLLLGAQRKTRCRVRGQGAARGARDRSTHETWRRSTSTSRSSGCPDTKIFMPTLNITYNDKMSMASSVEVRVPFLDREFTEFVAWNVKPGWKLKGKWRPVTKHIFREAMRSMLPEEVMRQPKAGFAAPVDYRLARDLHPW